MSDSTLLGATIDGDGVQFGVWAPSATASVTLELGADGDGGTVVMDRQAGGIWTTHVAGAGAGTRYRFRIDDQPPFPDPYSRYQPDGVHGASEVIDPHAFQWTDGDWHGPDP